MRGGLVGVVVSQRRGCVMGFRKARELRKRQEWAEAGVERSIEKLRKKLAAMEALHWKLKHEDWGAQAEREL